MASTTYVDFVGPAVNAAWLNDVNNSTYRITNIIAIAGQTVFTVPTYVLGGRLQVWINGILQQSGTSFTETNTTTITFSEGLTVGLVVTVRG
jgi:hypothetical protein